MATQAQIDAPEHASAPLAPIEEAIASARYIADKTYLDEENTRVPYGAGVLLRAADWLRRNARFAWDRHGVVIAVPRITAGPDGSIDLFWKGDEYTLMVNIPLAPDELATYYGNRDDGFTAEGEVNIDTLSPALMDFFR